MIPATVHLGFEVGTGQPVTIPLRHMVVTGQTQEAGKTTTLEALIDRAAVQAVVFLTKRGEGSFTDARVIPPYFREQADWQFVASILEASRGEKMRIERAWIIRASKGAKSLADVQRNVRKAMVTAKGFSGDMYLVLDAYLDAVVPQIETVEWAPSVALEPGVNAMDLTGLNVEMQHLVIRSTIDWVLHHEEGTVVVVPEAWKFIPQGRGTPVKLAAESYIRQAAGLKNYLWLDSQDIAGVDKMILKSVPVWILGVQRESNEVKRTLAQIPASIKKPKPEAIATLGLGEFFACYGSHITRVYVRPSWLSDAAAEAIARGTMAAESVRPPQRRWSTIIPHPDEDTVNTREAAQLREENENLKRRVLELERLLNRGSAPLSTPDPHIRREEAPAASAKPAPARVTPVSPMTFAGADDEAFYLAVKHRLLTEASTDPILLRVLTTRPELRVEVEREVITIDGKTLRGRIARLIADGFFDEASVTSMHVFTELQKRGGKDASVGVSNELGELTRMGFLTKENKWYRLVPGAKINVMDSAA